MGLILYLIGVALTIYAIVDLFKKNLTAPAKWLSAIVLLLTSWVGLLVYFLYARNRMETWFGKA